MASDKDKLTKAQIWLAKSISDLDEAQKPSLKESFPHLREALENLDTCLSLFEELGSKYIERDWFIAVKGARDDVRFRIQEGDADPPGYTVLKTIPHIYQDNGPKLRAVCDHLEAGARLFKDDEGATGTATPPEAPAKGQRKRGPRKKYTARQLKQTRAAWNHFRNKGGSMQQFLEECHEVHGCDTLQGLRRLLDRARKHSE